MKKAEFDRIVKESVDGGNSKADAEAYVVSGFKIPTDDKGKPVFEDAKTPPAAKPKKRSSKSSSK